MVGIVFNGQVTALDCKSSLITNCRIGLAVRGFESLPAHKMELLILVWKTRPVHVG